MKEEQEKYKSARIYPEDYKKLRMIAAEYNTSVVRLISLGTELLEKELNKK